MPYTTQSYAGDLLPLPQKKHCRATSIHHHRQGNSTHSTLSHRRLGQQRVVGSCLGVDFLFCCSLKSHSGDGNDVLHSRWPLLSPTPHLTVSGWHPMKRTQFLARLLSRLRPPELSMDGYLALVKGPMDATENDERRRGERIHAAYASRGRQTVSPLRPGVSDSLGRTTLRMPLKICRMSKVIHRSRSIQRP